MRHIRFFECDLEVSAAAIKQQWSTHALPWLVYPGAQGKTAFFTEWILSPGRTNDGFFLTGLRGGLRPAAYTEWLEWAEYLLDPGRALDILLDHVHRSQVTPLSLWIMLPYPYGQLDQTRLRELQKWTRTIKQRWDKRFGLSGHQLAGLVWGREAIPDNDVSLVRSFHAWLQNEGISSMWLANYGSTHVQDWRHLGFTQAALFSNYTGKGPYSRQWLDAALSFATVHQMGLQCVYGSGLRFEASSYEHYLEAVEAYEQAGNQGPIVHRFVLAAGDRWHMATAPFYDELHRLVTSGDKRT